VHNSRRHSIAFLHCDPVTLTFDQAFDLLIGGRGIVMDYPCAKFGGFSFNRFGFIVYSFYDNEY